MYKFLFLIVYVNAFAQYSIADSLMNVGDYNNAIKEYKKLDYHTKNYKIAKVLEAKGNNSEALDYYKSYLKHDSLNVEVNFNYGLLLLNLSRNKDAQKTFEKLVNSNPNEVYFYYLGLAFEKDKDQINSLKNYVNSVKLDSLYFKSNYKLAVFQSNSKQYSNALKITNRFLSKNNEDVEMLKLRAQIYFAQEDFINSIQDLNKLITLEQSDTFIFEKLAKSYFGNKEFQKSIDIYNTLIENSDEENADYFYSRGKCYGYLGKTKEAEIDINKAIKLKAVSFENEYFYLGYFYQINQNLEKALYYYDKTTKQDRNHAEAVFQIILINDYKGLNEEKSIKDFEKYLINFKNISDERKSYIENRVKQLKQNSHMK